MAKLAGVHRSLPTFVVLTGLALLFLGEQAFAESGTIRTVLSGAGALAVLAAAVYRIAEAARASEDRRPVAFAFAGTTAGVLLAVGLYGVALFMGGSQPLTHALWPLALTLSLTPLLAIELAVFPMRNLPFYERAGVAQAQRRGTGLALLLASAVLGNFVATRHDVEARLASSARATASDATKRAVRELTKPIEVTLFWSGSNEVGDLVESYFEPLEDLNPQLSVERKDHALATARAQAVGVVENGWVAVSHDKVHEKIRVGAKIRAARSALRRLDREVLEALLKVSVRKRVAYFTAGHGERSLRRKDKDDPRSPLTLLRRQLEAWQFEVKPFGVSEGSTQAVPEDASLVVVAGATKAFLPAELEVLDRARRILVLLDGENGAVSPDALIAPWGLGFDPIILANARSNAPLTRTRADRTSIWTNRYSSHPSLTTMSRNSRLATVLGRSGALQKQPVEPVRGKTDIVLTAVDDTFADRNGNLERDPDEPTANFPLAAAVTETSTQGASAERRAFVLADVDLFSDELLEVVQGNFYLFRDIIAWLQIDEDPIVPSVSEKDVKIVHQAEEDAVLFYGTTFGVPLLILGLGFLATRRRRNA